MMDLENHTKTQGHDMSIYTNNGLYSMINSDYTNDFNTKLKSQVTQSLKPVGPYTSSVDAVRPATTTTGGGLVDSLLNIDWANPGTWDSMGNMMSGIGSLGNIWMGYQQMGLLEDQLGLQREQWNETLAELNHQRELRDRTTTQYMA